VKLQEVPFTDDLGFVYSKIKAMASGWVEVVEIVGSMHQHCVHVGQHHVHVGGASASLC
jgi:hypothetical protein